MDTFEINEKGQNYLKSLEKGIFNEIIVCICIPLILITLNQFIIGAPAIIAALIVIYVACLNVFRITRQIRQYQQIIVKLEIINDQITFTNLKWTFLKRSPYLEVRHIQAFDYFEKKKKFNDTFGTFCTLGKQDKVFFLMIYDYFDSLGDIKDKIRI